MHKFYYILGITTVLFFCSMDITYTKRRDKKLSQFVKKTYGEEIIVKKSFTIPDSLLLFDENKAFILSKGDSTLGYLLFNIAIGCRVGGCASNDSNANIINHDPYYFATIYNTDKTIKKIKIMEYYSDYGLEITSKKWLRQFISKKSDNLVLGENINGISGATISVNSLIKELKNQATLIDILNSNIN